METNIFHCKGKKGKCVRKVTNRGDASLEGATNSVAPSLHCHICDTCWVMERGRLPPSGESGQGSTGAPSCAGPACRNTAIYRPAHTHKSSHACTADDCVGCTLKFRRSHGVLGKTQGAECAGRADPESRALGRVGTDIRTQRCSSVPNPSTSCWERGVCSSSSRVRAHSPLCPKGGG